MANEITPTEIDILLKGNKHLVFLIHGFTGTPIELKFVATFLHQKGFSVYAPFFKTFGYHPSYGASSCQHYSEWIDEVHEKLQTIPLEYSKISIGGLCLGGVLSIAAATLYHHKFPIDRVIAYSPLLKPDGWSTPWYRIFLPLLPIVPFLKHYSYAERFPYGIKNDLLRSIVIEKRKKATIDFSGDEIFPFWGIYQDWKLGHYVFKHLLKDFNLPTLILHPIQDDLVAFSNAERLFKMIKSPRKFLVPLDNSYHMITIDQERKKVAEISFQFIQEHYDEVLKECS